MNWIQKVIKWAMILVQLLSYMLVLFFVVVVITGLFDSITLFGDEPAAYTLRRGIPCLLSLILSISFVWLLVKIGYSLWGMMLYTYCYFSVGLVFNYYVSFMAKNFAPAPPEEILFLYCYSILWMIGTLVVAVLSMLLLSRRGQIWHANWISRRGPMKVNFKWCKKVPSFRHD